MNSLGGIAREKAEVRTWPGLGGHLQIRGTAGRNGLRKQGVGKEGRGSNSKPSHSASGIQCHFYIW